MSNLVKCGVELKMNWLNWSILISSGFQFQFNSNSKSFNSIPIQFMLNWIELIINSNSIHELIRALKVSSLWKWANFSNFITFCKLAHLFSCDQAALQMVFSVCLSVRPSVRLSHLFHHVPIIVSSWNFQELVPWSKVMSMQKVKVRGQRSRSQRSTPNLAVSGL